jgi:predicted Zn-dependent protease
MLGGFWGGGFEEIPWARQQHDEAGCSSTEVGKNCRSASPPIWRLDHLAGVLQNQRVMRAFMKSRACGWNGVLAALVVLLVTGCETNPYTKRSQLLLISEAQEQQMGVQAYQQVLNDPKNKISNDPKEVDPVKRVAARIIAAAKISLYAESASQFQWQVVVIKDDRTPNAFALPGGKIAVYTGIFPFAKNEAGLAAVMGHEVIHALARHGAERMSQGQLANVIMTAGNVALGASGTNPFATQAIMQGLGLGAQVGVLLPFSRKHESEADYIGLLLAAQAGYDPQEAVRLWERMESAGGGGQLEFLSTHPGHGTRIKDLEAAMPEAMTLYNQSSKLGLGGDLPRVGKETAR